MSYVWPKTDAILPYAFDISSIKIINKDPGTEPYSIPQVIFSKFEFFGD